MAILDATRRARVTPASIYHSLRAPALMATPMVVTGLWFSRDAMVRPLDRVETFRGSALISSLSVLATACAWAANVLLAVA